MEEVFKQYTGWKGYFPAFGLIPAPLEYKPALLRRLPKPYLKSLRTNPIVLTFDEEERGLRVFFAARWINNTAHSGPWSDIESAFIP